MAQADTDKKLEEKFNAANHKLEEIQKVGAAGEWLIICLGSLQSHGDRSQHMLGLHVVSPFVLTCFLCSSTPHGRTQLDQVCAHYGPDNPMLRALAPYSECPGLKRLPGDETLVLP